MAGVFISYRREDSPGHAGRLFDRVRARFGTGIVFMDVTAIDAGVDFVETIEQAVGTCDVLLAVIGPQWASAADGGGRKRLESPTDFVRIEIAGALKRGVRVVPVLVDGARLPAAADLPEDLQPLLRRNAVELRDSRWDADTEQLIASLERVVKAPDPPLRLERQPRRLRWIAALAVLVVSVGVAAVFGPRFWTPAPKQEPVAPETKPVTPPAATPAAVTPPNVVGRPLADAKEMLRRAGVELSRVQYVEDRTKAVDLVVSQRDVLTAGRTVPAVALTAVARAVVVIHHRPEDAGLARGLLGSLTSSKITEGLALRTFQTSIVRPDTVAHVTYSDSTLADTAAGIAKDANAWLAANDPARPALAAALQPKVVSRNILIGVPDRGGTTSSALPDVRGLGLAGARRMLSAAGVAVEVKWADVPDRKPLEVLGQTEVAGRTKDRTVVLDVAAKGVVLVYHLSADSAPAERFARDLRTKMTPIGILVRQVTVNFVRPELLGKVGTTGTMLARDARTIATFASDWLTREMGRTVTVETVDVAENPRQLSFGLLSLP